MATQKVLISSSFHSMLHSLPAYTSVTIFFSNYYQDKKVIEPLSFSFFGDLSNAIASSREKYFPPDFFSLFCAPFNAISHKMSWFGVCISSFFCLSRPVCTKSSTRGFFTVFKNCVRCCAVCRKKDILCAAICPSYYYSSTKWN